MSKKTKLKELFIDDLGKATGGKGHTTLALGEEGPVETTLAIGEECYTTYIIGEDCGGVATTMAIGEEDNGIPE